MSCTQSESKPLPRIDLIIIHCAATPNGKSLTRDGKRANETIDAWHKERGFRRSDKRFKGHNDHLKHIGYHYVIDTDGAIYTGRAEGEQGAHVRGYNRFSLGVCMVGMDKFTIKQWRALQHQIQSLREKYPHARICGHRDLSPDIDGDGTVEPHEWTKLCPCFNIKEWLESFMAVPQNLVFDDRQTPV